MGFGQRFSEKDLKGRVIGRQDSAERIKSVSESIIIVDFDVVPIPYLRMTQGEIKAAQGNREVPEKYKAKFEAIKRYMGYKDTLKWLAKKKRFTLPEEKCDYIFYMPVSPSRLKKEPDIIGKAHQQKPDWDNLVKSIQDALAKEDSKIWNVGSVSKVWSLKPGIKIIYDPNRKIIIPKQ